MITIIKQTDNNIKVNFKEDGEVFDITDYTVLFTVKSECRLNQEDDKAVITKDITDHTDPAQGETAIILSNTETNISSGKYYFDLRLVKDGVITQTTRDELEVVEGITKRTD